MSDLEDEDVILDDIKALQEVLTKKQSDGLKKELVSEDPFRTEHSQCEPSTSQANNPLSPSSTIQDSCTVDPLVDGEESDNEWNENINSSLDLSSPEAALNLNRKIINLLVNAQRKLRLLLKECQRKQVLIDEKLQKLNSNPFSRTLLTISGIPYFKDKRHFPAPKNQDAKLKANRGELQIIELPCPLRWTLKDRNTLWEAIFCEAKMTAQQVARKQQPNNGQHLSYAEDPLNLEFKLTAKRIPEQIAQTFKNLVGPIGSREFDWLKIAVTDFNERHSASECRAMWNVFLHPDINKSKWKKAEDMDLKKLAENYNFQNWDLVAEKLGTNRTGYQCFIRFNTNFRNNMLNRNSFWSKEEDQKLIDAVNGLRTGNFIPWGEVAKLMGQRRKQQIYMRWNYSLAPNLKKGRFTEEEDKLLLAGVNKFGANFTKISVSLLPHRTTAQLNDHYRTLLHEKKNEWTLQDDTKLVDLVEKFGNNWSAISKEFSNKSRVQVRHRHTSILRYLSRGLSLRSIPRWGQKSEEACIEDSTMTGEERLQEISRCLRTPYEKDGNDGKRSNLSDIDIELQDYFKGMYRTTSKPGRNSKFYTAEELNYKTPRLHVILQLLNADLDIPDDFDQEPQLTEKDKQLLTSLVKYSRDETLASDMQQKLVEYTRQKMFGSSMLTECEDRFIPPFPFDGKKIISRIKKGTVTGINYNPMNEPTTVELDKNFKTPELVISQMGGLQSELAFEKMAKKFIGKTENFPTDTVFSKEIPERSGKLLPIKFISLPNSGKLNSASEIIDMNAPSTSGIVSNPDTSETEQSMPGINESSSKITRRKLTKYWPEMLIPPNYTTLLGFRGILLSKHILEADNLVEDEYDELEDYRMTTEGRQALELFEERLAKLFKFPIELSEVAPPVLHDMREKDLDSVGNNCQRRRKGSKECGGSETKRKAKFAKLNVEEISET
ncbi:snRNA-activating protein complex subunit 4 [Neodiprion fabricii]|uniref:snRNA-activating protein complex subunit 4 n=1 Tax=Neodiprion fabricii TaxID=2872261 RepID=UPI001ED9324C|nr:snRNA-activating protein complex subunit 4 [Neodiprion fabricii]